MKFKNLADKGQGIGKSGLLAGGSVPDCLFLAAIEILSLVLYAPKIGFYTDDWAFLSIFRACPSQSFFGLFGCLYSGAPNTQDRPVQILLLATLYKLGGVRPIASQVFIAIFLVATVVMFYLVLRELQFGRLVALSLPLIYGLLPQYSTDRFWMASAQSLVAMFFGFLCFYCALRSAIAIRRVRWRWQMGCLAALIVSAFAYEICVPMFVLVPVAYWYRAKRRLPEATRDSQRYGKGTIAFFLAAAFLIAAVTVYKLVAMLGTFHFRFLHHIPQVIELGLTRTVRFNFTYYGLGLPAIAWNAARFYPDSRILIFAGILACLTVVYFSWVGRSSRLPLPGARTWIRMLGLGVIVYGLGYAPFFAWIKFDFTTMGPENRISLAAAAGAAIIMVSLLGLASSVARSDLNRARIFTALVAFFAVCGFVIVNTLGSFWIAAYQRQNDVVASIHQRFPAFPQGSTLIVDGLCPNIGPAQVFDFDYDLRGALRISYNDPGLRADLVNPAMKIGSHGLTSITYGFLDTYAYGNHLILFNLKEGVIDRLTSAEVARNYFQQHDPDFNGACRPARSAPSIYPFTKSGYVNGWRSLRQEAK